MRSRIAGLTNYFLNHGVADPATAHQQAIIALGKVVKQQALVQGFSDTFMVLGVVLLLSAAAILMTRKTKASTGGGGAH